MNHVSKTLTIKTNRRNEMLDITSQIEAAIGQSSIDTGFVMVFCPHTTAGITINENADPDVTHDILLTLEELLPQLRTGYRHAEGNSDAHVKSSLTGASEMVCIQNGYPVLGTWQGIYFCEFDGPRNRKVILHIFG